MVNYEQMGKCRKKERRKKKKENEETIDTQRLNELSRIEGQSACIEEKRR